ncbi:MAG: winged helix-turn-helix domain-containing protein [Candidatus ainarchaeum sp.]|nr:winged helix-turn-helix domain-containing protein [Candidatus ainarchaeum sp.]
MFLSKRIVYWLLVGSRGGENRIKILLLLKKEPSNLKKIADSLNLDYKTVQHHADIMSKHGLVESTGNRYGKIFFVSQDMEEMWIEFGQYLEKTQ